MKTIKENLDLINRQIFKTALSCNRLPEDIKLIAVSKKKSAEVIKKARKAGAKNFGENYIQEAVEKINKIADDSINWHFIGHLQSNKANVAVRYFEYIHTVDTLKLAKKIDNQAKKIDKIQKILVQVNIGEELTKSGTRIEDTIKLVKQIQEFENIKIMGLMCMPPYFTDPENARDYFKHLVHIKEKIMNKNFDNDYDNADDNADDNGNDNGDNNNISMAHLSMGMSNDFKVAIEEGATMVRVGTSIFGKRS